MTPEDIQREARSMIGTPFGHGGRTPGPSGSLDCAGVPAMIATRLGYPFRDVRKGYSRIPDGRSLLALFREAGDEVPITDLRPSDVGIFWFNPRSRDPQHVGVFVARPDGIGIVHAYEHVGRVVEHLFRPHDDTPSAICITGRAGRSERKKRSPYSFWQDRLIHVIRWRGLTWPH